MTPLYLAVASFFGALAAASLGYLEAAEAFNAKKFGASVIRGLIAAVLYGVVTQVANSTGAWPDYLWGFLAGAGVDVVGKRAVAAVGKVVR